MNPGSAGNRPPKRCCLSPRSSVRAKLPTPPVSDYSDTSSDNGSPRSPPNPAPRTPPPGAASPHRPALFEVDDSQAFDLRQGRPVPRPGIPAGDPARQVLRHQARPFDMMPQVAAEVAAADSGPDPYRPKKVYPLDSGGCPPRAVRGDSEEEAQNKADFAFWVLTEQHPSCRFNFITRRWDRPDNWYDGFFAGIRAAEEESRRAAETAGSMKALRDEMDVEADSDSDWMRSEYW